MAYETIVAVFDNRAHADAAVKALRAGGYAEADISIFDEERLAAGKKSITKHAGLWHRLFGEDIHQHEAAIYSQTIEHGGVVLSARVPENEVAHAIALLDLHRPVNVHDRAVTAGVAEPAHVTAVEKKIEKMPLVSTQKIALPPKVAEQHGEVLQLAEEQLQVGKKLVESGRTRVRRFMTERPVTENVTLHEEHAEVIRRAIDDPKFVGNVDWADREIEVKETAEQALINKTARIVEEVALKKIGKDHVQTISEKLRRQQVEVERLGPDGKPMRQQPKASK
jgi:uncharacterized protein (TIGR02271 family)